MLNCLLGQGCPLNDIKLVVIYVAFFLLHTIAIFFLQTLLLELFSSVPQQSWREQGNPRATTLYPEVALGT